VLHGCEALQIFAKNASQWRGAPLDRDEIRRFRRLADASGITPIVSHASYLINLATTVPALREQSIAAFAPWARCSSREPANPRRRFFHVGAAKREVR
jgi:deoxyribonuclease-4